MFERKVTPFLERVHTCYSFSNSKHIKYKRIKLFFYLILMCIQNPANNLLINLKNSTKCELNKLKNITYYYKSTFRLISGISI